MNDRWGGQGLESGVDEGEPEGVAGRAEAVDEADLDASAVSGTVVNAYLESVERLGLVPDSALQSGEVRRHVDEADLEARRVLGIRAALRARRPERLVQQIMKLRAHLLRAKCVDIREVVRHHVHIVLLRLHP